MLKVGHRRNKKFYMPNFVFGGRTKFAGEWVWGCYRGGRNLWVQFFFGVNIKCNGVTFTFDFIDKTRFTAV